MRKTKVLYLTIILCGLFSSCNYPIPLNKEQYKKNELSNAVTKISKEYGIKSTVFSFMTQTETVLKQNESQKPTVVDHEKLQQTSISNLSSATQIVRPISVISTANPNNDNCEKGEFVDESIPDGSKVLTDQIFEQTWVIQNTGCNIWTSDYAIVFVDGSKMNAPERVKLGVQVPPGKLLKIGSQFKAPHDEGRYRSTWMLQDKDGKKFGLGKNGRGFWVDIIVVGATILTQSPLTPYPTSPLLPTLPGGNYPTYDPRLPLPTLPLLPTLPGGNHPTYDPRLPLPTLPPLIVPTIPPIVDPPTLEPIPPSPINSPTIPVPTLPIVETQFP